MATIRNLVVRISANDRQIKPAITRVNKSLSGLSKNATKVGKISLVRTAQIGALSALASGAAASAGSVVQLGAALAPAAGLLAALPAAALGAALAVGTLKVALSGMGNAMGAALSGDTAAFSEALKKLSPAARDVAREFRGVVPQLNAIKTATQDAFFAPLRGEIAATVTALSGPLKTAMSGLSAEFGFGAREVLRFVRSANTVASLQDIFGRLRSIAADLRPAIQPVLRGLLDIAQVGARFLSTLGPGFASLIKRFGEWLSAAANSGRAFEWMQSGLVVVKQLGEVLANVGGIIKSVFGAAGASGGNLLGTFGALTGALNAFLKTGEGKAALTQLFAGLQGIGSALAPVLVALVKGLGSVAPAIGRIAMAVGPVLTTAINALAPALAALAPGITALIKGLGGAFKAMAPALLPLATAISAIAVAIAPILPALGRLIAMLVMGLAAQIQNLVDSGALGTLVQAVIRLGMALGAALLEALIAIGPYLPGLVVAVSDLLIALVPLIPSIIDLAIALTPLIPIVTDVITMITELATAGMPTLVKGMEKITSAVKVVVAVVREGWSYISEWIHARIGDIGTYINGLMRFIGDIPGGVSRIFSGAVGWLYNTGRDILTGLWNGISSMANWIARAIGNLISRIIPGPVRRILGIASPSKLFAFFGKMLGAGLVAGMDSTRSMVSRAAVGLASAAVPQMATAGVPSMGTPSGVSRTAGSGSRDGFDYGRLAGAVAAAMRAEGVGATYIDGQQMTDHVSRRLGRATDQRRRTG